MFPKVLHLFLFPILESYLATLASSREFNIVLRSLISTGTFTINRHALLFYYSLYSWRSFTVRILHRYVYLEHSEAE